MSQDSTVMNFIKNILTCGISGKRRNKFKRSDVYHENVIDDKYMDCIAKCNKKPIFLTELHQDGPIWTGVTEKIDIRVELARLKEELKINYEFESEFQRQANNFIGGDKDNIQPNTKTYITKFARTEARILPNQTKFSLKLIKTIDGLL